MNPTDQARKEARRRELKKNKKQRILVRTAVLKGKNPREIIEEMEKIDDMEFNPVTPCPLNQKVMAEKRRKLKETWDRVISMYEKDAPEQWEDLKKLWMNYQGRKIDVVKYYESVLAAKDVHIDAIPLPNMSMSGEGSWEDSEIPLPPPSVVAPPKAILKKPASVLEPSRPRICPGVPAAPPPPIQDYEDIALPVPESRKRTIRFGQEDENEEEEESGRRRGEEEEEEEQQQQRYQMEGVREEREERREPQLNPLQRKMLEMAGQDLDQFMREMEEVHRQREAEKAASLQLRLSRLENEPGPPGIEGGGGGGGVSAPGPPNRPGVPPQGVRLPPGPPPGRPQGIPGHPSMAMPQRPGVAPPGVRPPPGPPPGVPPSLGAPPGVPPVRPNMPKPLGVLSAKPQLNKQEIKTDKVIESAPVMRNLKSDVTRFIPTHLRIKRDDHKREALKKKEEVPAMFAKPKVQQAQPQLTKDDAYKQFMEEMKDLL